MKKKNGKQNDDDDDDNAGSTRSQAEEGPIELSARSVSCFFFLYGYICLRSEFNGINGKNIQ